MSHHTTKVARRRNVLDDPNSVTIFPKQLLLYGFLRC